MQMIDCRELASCYHIIVTKTILTHYSILDIVQSCDPRNQPGSFGGSSHSRRADPQYKFDASPPAQKFLVASFISQVVPSHRLKNLLKISNPKARSQLQLIVIKAS